MEKEKNYEDVEKHILDIIITKKLFIFVHSNNLIQSLLHPISISF